jgi:alcohol dehydrogenase (NADP+)
MAAAKAFAALNASDPLVPFSFERRDVNSHDVAFDILYCGVCHSDIHQVRNEWGGSAYPMVPGHEIVGRVTATGDKVTKYEAGDLVAVGCLVDSCRECESCRRGLEQYCQKGSVPTYNGFEKDGLTPTYGGYSSRIVVHEDFVLRVPLNLPLEGVAPLLCAGITTYSPLSRWKVGKGHSLGVLGLGGLGHMGVKLGAALGAEVTMLSTSASKERDAKRLGAHHFALTTDRDALKKLRGSFDFILDTVSAPHDYNMYLSMLKIDGVHICVGAPPTPASFNAFSLISKRKSISGPMIGGISETQEMLDFCSSHQIVSDVEVIPISYINEAYERMMKGDVRYRFVIDLKSLK